ncbi:Pollen Ole e 1 allergen and extensin family protein [Hirschfeldia incana]|nr:Pollen Ole e 1 allergen and extensin family protein [Hirschfeldia incana]
MRFLFSPLALVFMLALGEAAGDRMGWSRKEMVEIAGYGEHKLSSVLVTASLLSSSSSPIPGATVGIKCHTGSRKRSEWIKAVTNELGKFTIDLPSHLHAIPDLDKVCSIKLLSVPKPYQCSTTKSQRGIKLVSSSNGLRVYRSGNITLRGGPCK